MRRPTHTARSRPGSCQRRAHEVGRVVRYVALGPRVARHADLHDRDVGRVELDDDRRLDARRQRPEHRLGNAGQLRHGGWQVGIRMEVDPDQRGASNGLRLDVLDAANRGGVGPLHVARDALLHLLRGHAGIGPHRRHHRDRDVREDVHRHGEHRHDAGNEDQDRAAHEGVRAAQGDPDQPHHGRPTIPARAALRARHGRRDR